MCYITVKSRLSRQIGNSPNLDKPKSRYRTSILLLPLENGLFAQKKRFPLIFPHKDAILTRKTRYKLHNTNLQILENKRPNKSESGSCGTEATGGQSKRE